MLEWPIWARQSEWGLWFSQRFSELIPHHHHPSAALVPQNGGFWFT